MCQIECLIFYTIWLVLNPHQTLRPFARRLVMNMVIQAAG